MKVSKKVNRVRRSVMQNVTKSIGRSENDRMFDSQADVKRVLISRPNHRLGNLLLLSALVQEVEETFPNAKIDLFVKGSIAPSIYRNYRTIDRIIQLPKKPFSSLFSYLKGWALLKSRKYDLVINASSGSSSGKLSTRFAHSRYKLYGTPDDNGAPLAYPDYRHFAKNSVYDLRQFLGRPADGTETVKVPSLNIRLDRNELEDGRKKLHGLVQNDRKTICLFTNATGDKCFSGEWWQEFYSHLTKAFPEYNIIELLPVENISRLNFMIPGFYSTDIREMGAFIANTALFVTADNGVMHLASAVGTPTVGLFSVTREELYRPYNSGSLSVDTRSADHQEITRIIIDSLS